MPSPPSLILRSAPGESRVRVSKDAKRLMQHRARSYPFCTAEPRRDMPKRPYRLGLPRMMLEITDLSVSYGGLAALRGVSLAIAEGQFIAIVGPNGAGKTTLFKAI